MPKRNRGGNNNGGRNLYSGHYVEGTPSNQRNADEIMKGTKDVLSDFGMYNKEDGIRGIYFTERTIARDRNTMAAVNGFNDIRISNKKLNEPLKDSNGYNINDTFHGVGTHEAGHAVVNNLINKKIIINGEESTKASMLEKATIRKKGKLEREVMKEAKKRYGSNPKISGYASKNVVEKVAEAVSDVYSNKSKANAYSKTIVGVLKDINTGKFKPKLKVSRSEMKM